MTFIHVIAFSESFHKFPLFERKNKYYPFEKDASEYLLINLYCWFEKYKLMKSVYKRKQLTIYVILQLVDI